VVGEPGVVVVVVVDCAETLAVVTPISMAAMIHIFLIVFVVLWFSILSSIRPAQGVVMPSKGNSYRYQKLFRLRSDRFRIGRLFDVLRGCTGIAAGMLYRFRLGSCFLGRMARCGMCCLGVHASTLTPT